MDSSETPYEPLINLEIEDAFHRKESSYTFSTYAENFTIDFKRMEGVDHAMGDKVFKVKRFLERKYYTRKYVASWGCLKIELKAIRWRSKWWWRV